MRGRSGEAAGGGGVPHCLTAGPTSALICSGSFRPPTPAPAAGPAPGPAPLGPLPRAARPQGSARAARLRPSRAERGPSPPGGQPEVINNRGGGADTIAVRPELSWDTRPQPNRSSPN